MTIAENKKAFHDYFIEDRYEAGLVLEGWEVKAIRDGRVQLKESYVISTQGGTFPVRRAHQPAAERIVAYPPASDPHQKTITACGRNRPVDQQG